MTWEDIIKGFDALTEADFDWGRTQSQAWEKLNTLCDAVRSLPDPGQAADAMFRVMERLSDADLGSPGPLVHTLETLPGYRVGLLASFRRKPARLTAWMLNRVLNITKAEADRAFLLDLLEQGISHPLADEGTRNQARQFVQHQKTKADHPGV